MITKSFEVTGMTCSACSTAVERAVGKLDSVEKVEVSLLTNKMKVVFDEGNLQEAEIEKAVQKVGYGIAQEMRTSTASNRKDNSEEEEKGMRKRILISISFLVPLMYVSMFHMFQVWFGLPVPYVIQNLFHGNENAVIFGLTQLLLLLPILYVNQKYFQVGFKTLWHGRPNMDTLIAVGSGAAVVYGVFALLRIGYGLGHQQIAVVEKYRMDLYFESAGMILTLITFGKYLESKSKKKTSEAIRQLMQLLPQMAMVERDGVVINIPVEEVQKEDILQVKPGEVFPVDGVIVEGETNINEAAITGESMPVEKSIGDSVIGATVNLSGFVRMQATKVGEDTTLAQIIHLVEEAASSKAPIAKIADKISGVFVPIVILIAIVTFIIWLLVGASFELAISMAIGVLVISCPCALGLATPVAIMVGTGKGASKGILMKSGQALQECGKITAVVFDKTGTLTEGKPRVADVHLCGKIDKQEFITLLASLEANSEHPLSKAIVEEGQNCAVVLRKVEGFRAAFGKGIMGEIEGVSYYAGNEALLNDIGLPMLASYKDKMQEFAVQGETPLLFFTGKEILGIVGIADQVKPTSKEAVEAFVEMGIKTVMLTGDNTITAMAIQKQLKLDEVIAEVLPGEKEQKIRQLQAEGHTVAMIGDGINDAPALSASNVGMAIAAGTDIAMESADVVLMKNDLLDAVRAVFLSRQVVRNIKQNLFWAFFYNCIGIPLAAGLFYPIWGIKLSPMFGAAAMSLSSVFVVGNALRLRMWKEPKELQSIRRSNESEDTKWERSKQQESTIERNRCNVMFLTIFIEGMMCDHCKKRVETQLEQVARVESVKVNLEEKTAIVSGNELDSALLEEAVRQAGYEVVKIQ